MIKRLRLKAVLNIILSVIVILLCFVPLIYKGYTFNDLFGNYCVVNEFDDVKKCIDRKDYFVKIKTDSVIDPKYVFSLNSSGDDVAALLDVGLRISDNEEDGYVSLIGILPLKSAAEFLEKHNNSQTIEFVTHLGSFTKEDYKQGFDYIKNSYIDYYTSKEYAKNYGIIFSEEQAQAFILDINFDSYTYSNSLWYMYLYVFILLLPILIFMINLIINLFKLIFPFSSKRFNGLNKKEILAILSNNADDSLLFFNKNVTIGKKYFYITTKNLEIMGKTKDIVWVYSKKSKRKYYLVINLNNKNSFEVCLLKKDIINIIDNLKENQKIITTFSLDNYKKYKKNPKGMV